MQYLGMRKGKPAYGRTIFLSVLSSLLIGVACRFLLQYYSHNSKLASMANAVLYYCVCLAKTETSNRHRLWSLIRDKDAINLLFSSSVSGDKEEPSDWVQYLVSLILSCSNQEISLFSILYASLSSKSFATLSPTQLVLFHYVLQILDDSPSEWFLCIHQQMKNLEKGSAT